MEQYTWTSDETFQGTVQIAHYGAADLAGATVTATVSDSAGRDIASHAFPPTDLPRGALTEVGAYRLPLASADLQAPQKLTLTLEIDETGDRNRYPLWVYPPEVENDAPDDVLVTRRYADAETRQHLADGGRVLLLPELDELPKSLDGGFQTEFWSPMFAASARRRGNPEPPGTLGFLCDPESPALAHFPTEFHGNWQWWHLLQHSRPLVLDDAPDDYRPIVQPIDNFERNHRLGLIAETKVGPGSMLVCAIDLPNLDDRPEARQLMHSLLRYLGSPEFDPETELDPELLESLFPG
jgi:hypothetical protein